MASRSTSLVVGCVYNAAENRSRLTSPLEGKRRIPRRSGSGLRGAKLFSGTDVAAIHRAFKLPDASRPFHTSYGTYGHLQGGMPRESPCGDLPERSSTKKAKGGTNPIDIGVTGTRTRVLWIDDCIKRDHTIFEGRRSPNQ